MKHISELQQILRSQWAIDKRKLECMACLITAMISFRTVNLTQLVKGLPKKAKMSSRYRRVQRFLSSWSATSHDWLGPWLLSWFFDEKESLSLTMDRSNWQWGKSHINFLMVAVVYKRMAIPLLWTLLPKKGNSNCEERAFLIRRVLKYIPLCRIKNLLCDREFVGHDWLSWLMDERIPFKIRVKDNYLTLTSGGAETTVAALFHDLKPGEQKSIKGQRAITHHKTKVYLTGSRLVSGKLMVVASNEPSEGAIESYCERWEIETLFQNLKSRGFDFEATHLIDHDRLDALMSLAVIAGCWCYRVGEWQIEQGELIKLKKHNRPSKSLFRHGLDCLSDLLATKIRFKPLKPLLRLWYSLIPARTAVNL